MKYVEIEKPVEVEKIVERIVEKQADTAGSVEAMACDLLDNIYFEFDKDVLTAASEKTLDRLAGLLKSSSRRPLPDYRLHRWQGEAALIIRTFPTAVPKECMRHCSNAAFRQLC
mgnify:CR=1 FL=1